jgi:hypothetical protein
MKISGKIVGANIDFRTGKPTISFEINEKNDFELMVDELKDCEKLSIEAKPYRPKRSLNANNYAWALLTEIANIARANKEDIYLLMLKRYGQSEMFSVSAHVPFGEYVKYYEEAGESVLKGKLFKHYKVYKGSSEFDSREMAVFIDGIVSEAKALGIQTETPEMIAKMKSLWGE